MPETQIKIDRIRVELEDFAGQHKEGARFRRMDYKRGKNEIKDDVKYMRIRYKSMSPLRDTGDFEHGEFYGFCGDVEQNKERWGKRNGSRNRRSGRNY